MFRPDKLGLIGCVVIFVLSFIFQGQNIGTDTYREDSVSKRRPPPPIVTQERRRPDSRRPQPTLPPISQKDPTIK